MAGIEIKKDKEAANDGRAGMFNDEALMPRVVRFDSAAFRAVHSIGEPLDWPDQDKTRAASRMLGNVIGLCAEITSCSPVIPTSELQRIRNNVVAQYSALRNNYSNVGGSLDSRGLVSQYQAVFDAMEYDSFCYKQSDQHLIDDINTCAQGANIVLRNAFGQYANNFSQKLSPMRTAYSQLQQAAGTATNDIGPTLDAYKRFWSLNFAFQLHTGVNSSLDSFIADYQRVCDASEPTFNQGNARVQNNFRAEYQSNGVIFESFGKAHEVWDKQDGAQGFAAFEAQLSPFQSSLNVLSRFVVLDTPENTQIFAKLRDRVQIVKNWWAGFPNFPQAQASVGLILDPGTSALKFYARQSVLNAAQGAGAYFNSTISPGNSLIVTGFSYQHGGKMPPHAEHKDGKDCDLFSVYFKVGGTSYNEQKSIQMATYLLKLGVTRLIYTNASVVNAANAACPTNAVAVAGTGHETHMHFDMDNATAATPVA